MAEGTELFELDDLRQDATASSPGSVKQFNANGRVIPNVGDPVDLKDAANLDTVNTAVVGMVTTSEILTDNSIIVGKGTATVGIDSTLINIDASLTVDKKLITQNNFIVDNGLIASRTLFLETWSAGNNTLNGDLGTWVISPAGGGTPNIPLPPDGGNCHRHVGTGYPWTLTSPSLDLKFHHLLEAGDSPSIGNIFTRTRVAVKGWITTHSLDAGTAEELYVDVFDGSDWHEVYAHRATNGGGAQNAIWYKFVCDISSYISDISNTQIRIRVEGNVGGSDRWGIGRIIIYESDMPTQLGNLFIGRNGISINKFS